MGKNKGSPGVDGITVDELPKYLAENWGTIRAQLLLPAVAGAAGRDTHERGWSAVSWAFRRCSTCPRMTTLFSVKVSFHAEY